MSENKICLYKVECELTNWKDRFTNHDGDTLFFPAAMYSEQRNLYILWKSPVRKILI